MNLLLAPLLLMLGTSGAWANPVPGVFRSGSAGGAVCDGRVSVARVRVGANEAHVLHAESWDGTALGRQWKIRCAVRVSCAPIDSSRFDGASGNGDIVAEDRYYGGTFLLFDDAAVGWGAGTGSLDTTTVTRRVRYANFAPVETRVALLASARFSHGGCRMDIAVLDGRMAGAPVDRPAPNQYPELLATDCRPSTNPARPAAWIDARAVTVEITPDAPARGNTGYARAIYRRLCTLWRIGGIGQGEESTGSGSLREE